SYKFFSARAGALSSSGSSGAVGSSGGDLDQVWGLGSSGVEWLELARAARSTRADSIQNARPNHGGSIVAEQDSLDKDVSAKEHAADEASSSSSSNSTSPSLILQSPRFYAVAPTRFYRYAILCLN
ncbi:hypothetical protein DFH09DRAFT_1270830, partial [Mycena vulgaris]